MTAEPELEELSAYLDQQVSSEERQRLEGHLAGCEICRRRLDAMRHTVHAVRTLPMESPPRAFTIPSGERRVAVRWAPLAWAGGTVAAAALVVMAGFVVLHSGTRGGGASSAMRFEGPSAESSRLAQGGAPASELKAAQDFSAIGATAMYASGSLTRRLTLQTNLSSYPARGTMVVRITLDSGSPALDPARGPAQNGIKLALIKDGYAVELPAPFEMTVGPGQTIVASYHLADLPLSVPRAGTYRLVATWSLPDAPGTALVVEVPVTLAGG